MATQADFDRIGNYAVVLSPQENIDRSRATRTVPMQVLCLGYSRTGTLTMHRALTTLCYPSPYHFSSLLSNVQDSDLWLAALRTKFYGTAEVALDESFFDGLLGHVSAITDSPANLFGEELLAAYPDARIVLVERDIDSWYSSWMEFCNSAYDPFIRRLGKLDPGFLGRITAVGGVMTQICAGYGRNLEEARVRSKGAYRAHYAEVRRFVPKERLLEFRLEEGWEPLCEFLGKDLPDVPFPHENEKEANKLAFAVLAKVGMQNVARNALILTTALVVPGAIAWRYWKRT